MEIEEIGVLAMAKRSSLPFAIPSTFKLTSERVKFHSERKITLINLINQKALKGGNLCNNDRCNSCYYVERPSGKGTSLCTYYLKTKQRRNSGVGYECDKWRSKK